MLQTLSHSDLQWQLHWYPVSGMTIHIRHNVLSLSVCTMSTIHILPNIYTTWVFMWFLYLDTTEWVLVVKRSMLFIGRTASLDITKCRGHCEGKLKITQIFIIILQNMYSYTWMQLFYLSHYCKNILNLLYQFFLFTGCATRKHFKRNNYFLCVWSSFFVNAHQDTSKNVAWLLVQKQDQIKQSQDESSIQEKLTQILYSKAVTFCWVVVFTKNG